MMNEILLAVWVCQTSRYWSGNPTCIVTSDLRLIRGMEIGPIQKIYCSATDVFKSPRQSKLKIGCQKYTYDTLRHWPTNR